ncbi:MAG: DUF1345 domain-containing protein [Novosphingobium sp.]
MASPRGPIGTRILPLRFLVFASLMIGVTGVWHAIRAGTWGDSLVVGFDFAALIFALSLLPLANDHCAADLRRHAEENDANRGWVLVITGFTALTILAAIVSELPAARQGDFGAIVKLVGTLALSWVFTNLVFMLHYAHLHYSRGPVHDSDHGGFEFPGTPDPDYWDFLYFSFTAGMSFAASDVNVTHGRVRRVLVAQCLLSFVFNIGVLAFAINVLAGAAG